MHLKILSSHPKYYEEHGNIKHKEHVLSVFQIFPKHIYLFSCPELHWLSPRFHRCHLVERKSHCNLFPVQLRSKWNAGFPWKRKITFLQRKKYNKYQCLKINVGTFCKCYVLVPIQKLFFTELSTSWWRVLFPRNEDLEAAMFFLFVSLSVFTGKSFD